MKRGTTKHDSVGKRIEIPAYSDLWMQGARFGTIERFVAGVGGGIFVVRMDNPQVKRLARFLADDCAYAEILK